MKTYTQFVSEAYTHSEIINEFNVGNFARDRINDVGQGLRNFKKNPLRSIRQSASGIGRYYAKDQIAQPVVNTLKRATGNKPVTNAVLDTAGLVAPSMSWRGLARAAGPLAKPALAAGALVLATPTSTSKYDQVTGPNAYDKNPALRKNQTPRPRIRAGY